MNDRSNDEIRPRQAVTDQLLHEAHGAASDTDLTESVRQALAADGGAAAALRAAEAEGAAAGSVPGNRAPTRWLLAAIVLLGIGVVTKIAMDSERADESSNRPPSEALQDPTPDQDGVVRVDSLQRLRELLSAVEDIEVEPLWLDDSNVVGEIQLAGAPIHLTADQRDGILAGIRSTARIAPAAGWNWQNAVRLRLRGGGHIEMAIYTYGRGKRLTLGMQGLRGDLTVGEPAASLLRESLSNAKTVARMAHGIVLHASELVGEGRFPTSSASLRIFVDDAAVLVHLRDYSELQHLDLSGMRATLNILHMTAIGRCRQLRTLNLSGPRLQTPRGFLSQLRTLDNLERLTLHRVEHLSGADLVRPGSLRSRTGSTWALDLTGCGALDAEGLTAIARSKPTELILDRCALDDAELRTFLAAQRTPLQVLSLRSNPGISAAAVQELLRDLPVRRLDVRYCEFSEEEQAALATAAEERGVELQLD